MRDRRPVTEDQNAQVHRHHVLSSQSVILSHASAAAILPSSYMLPHHAPRDRGPFQAPDGAALPPLPATIVPRPRVPSPEYRAASLVSRHAPDPLIELDAELLPRALLPR